MPQRDERVYLVHMLEAAREATAFLANGPKRHFLADRKLRLALERLIQMVGEAARCVPPETRSRHPAIPWADIVGMRNRLVHDYLRIDEEEVWSVVTRDLPSLIAELERIVPPGLESSDTEGPAGLVREPVAHP